MLENEKSKVLLDIKVLRNWIQRRLKSGLWWEGAEMFESLKEKSSDIRCVCCSAPTH